MDVRNTVLSLGILLMLLTNSFPLIFAEEPALDYPFTESDEVIHQATSYLLNQQEQDGNINGLATSAWSAMALSSILENHHSFHNLSTYLIEKTSIINTEKITDIERHILALICCDIFENDSSIQTLINQLYKSYDGKQIGDISNIYDDIFGILALISIGEEKESTMISTTANHIKTKQRTDGSWGDVDTTAAAIMALIQSGEQILAPSIQDALTYLKTKQESSGGFQSWGSANIASTAWVVNALIAAKINPCSNAWTTEGKTPIDFILSLQKEDGSFNYSKTQRLNPEWMTSYALVALLGNTYPVQCKNITLQIDEDPSDDKEEDDESDEEDNENKPFNETIQNLTLIHPDTQGIYVHNSKIKTPTSRLICFGPLDITVSTIEDVDRVRFLIDGTCFYEDTQPPYRFSFDTGFFMNELAITIEAVCLQESINITTVETLLSQLLGIIKTYYQTPSSDLLYMIEDVVHQLNKCYINQIFTLQFSMIYTNILGEIQEKKKEIL